MATGAYLFGINPDTGKREPREVEHLTDKERHDTFVGRDTEELVGWINVLSHAVAGLETFLESEGYKVQDENEDNMSNNRDNEKRHNIGGSMNRPSEMQEAAYKEEKQKDEK